MTFFRLFKGQAGEDYAVSVLTKKGYKIIERNYRCRVGEIDIVAEHNHTLVFIEVRSRTSQTYGLPQESVGFKKQEKLRKLAQIYLMHHHRQNIPVRFDVVAVSLNKVGEVEAIEVIENAF